MLSALTQQAAQSLAPGYSVNPACNYYFMVASTVLTTVVGTFVTTRIVEPMLGEDPPWATAVVETDHARDEARAFGISAAGASWSASP